MSSTSAALFANLVLVLHVCVAIFVIAGLALILVGNLARWQWVNQFWFRMAHLVAIAVIVAEAWFGIACPLTLLEMWLRSEAGGLTYAGGFIEHWLSSLLYYQAPPWVFMLAYSCFGFLVVASWWYFPPKLRRSLREAGMHVGQNHISMFRQNAGVNQRNCPSNHTSAQLPAAPTTPLHSAVTRQ